MLAPWLALALCFEGPLLEVPWKCGDVRPCTQAHGGFSHTGDNYWAWDFDFAVGEEVLAASAGVVSHIEMSQPEGGCDPSFAALANYVVVDHGDGTSAGYTHLLANTSPLKVGDEVVQGMLIGRIGLSGYVCGDHLHFQVQTTCGSSFCSSVAAEFADYGDPVQGQSIESTNCPVCTIALDGGTTVADELDPGCFQRQTDYWWSTHEGDADHHFYTIASDAAEPETVGTWTFEVSVPGNYRIEAFIPQQDADAQGATYLIHHAGGTETVPLDQSTAKGWQDLGTYELQGGPDERVELPDTTGEAVDLQRHLAFDALRFTFVPPQSGTTGTAETTGSGTDPTGDGGTDGSASGPTGPSSGSTSADQPTTATVGTSSGQGLPGSDEGPTDSGCACAAHTPSHRGLPWALLLIVVPLRRRVSSTPTRWRR